MRVLIDTRGMYRDPTGAGKALAYLLRQLHADFPGHQYVPCAPDGAETWRLARQMLWGQAGLPWRSSGLAPTCCTSHRGPRPRSSPAFASS